MGCPSKTNVFVLCMCMLVQACVYMPAYYLLYRRNIVGSVSDVNFGHHAMNLQNMKIIIFS
jgi:hypothetical protein